MNEENFHLIPCSVKYKGTANVSRYFLTQAGDDKVKTASFRGRLLNGTEIKLPEGFIGTILEKNENDVYPQRTVSNGSFRKFNYWNWDKLPSANDSIKKMIDWIDFATVIHTEDD